MGDKKAESNIQALFLKELKKVLFLLAFSLIICHFPQARNSDNTKIFEENLRLKSTINRLQAPHASGRFLEMETGLPEKSITNVIVVGGDLYFQTRNHVYTLSDFSIRCFLNHRVLKMFYLQDRGMVFLAEEKLFLFDGKDKKRLHTGIANMYLTDDKRLILKKNRKEDNVTDFFFMDKNDVLKKFFSTDIQRTESIFMGGRSDDCLFAITKKDIYILNVEKDQRRKVMNDKGLSVEVSQRIFFHPQYGYLFSGENGITCFKDGEFYSFNNSVGLDPSYARVFLVDSKNRIWIGSPKYGLTVKTENGWKFYDNRDGLSNLLINAAAEIDDEVVFATDSGLFQLNNAAWDTVSTGEEPDRTADGVFLSAFCDTSTNSLYFGEFEGGVIRIDPPYQPGNMKYFTYKENRRLQIYSFFKYGEHVLLSTNDGIKTINEQDICNFNEFRHRCFIYSLYYSRTHKCLFVCCEEGLYYRFEGEKDFTRAKSIKALVWRVFEDSTESLWVLTTSGLCTVTIQNHSVNLLDWIEIDGSQSKYFATFMIPYQNGKYLLATNRGVYLLDKKKLLKTGVFRDELFSLETNHILDTGDGMLIFSTPRGIVRLRDNFYILENQEDGLRDNYVSQVIMDHSGNLWAVTDRGIAVGKKQPEKKYAVGIVLNHRIVFWKIPGSETRLYERMEKSAHPSLYISGLPVKAFTSSDLPWVDSREVDLQLFALDSFLTSDRKAVFDVEAGNLRRLIKYDEKKSLAMEIDRFSSGRNKIIVEYLNPNNQSGSYSVPFDFKVKKKISLLLWVTIISLSIVCFVIFFVLNERRKRKYIGSFKMIKVIGSGGMGEVWKAYDLNFRRTVALKIIHPHLVNNREIAERFKREMDYISMVKHKNIILMYERGMHKERVFISMEYIDGVSLSEFIEERKVAVQESLVVSAAISEALAAIHQKGIIHRDLKPHNILLAREHLTGKTATIYQRLADSIRITDFGIAKSEYFQSLTDTGMLVGTIQYVSPEQVKGKNVDSRSDIWSLGIILYQMLCGKTPFESQNMIEIIGKIIGEPVLPPSKLNPGIDQDVENIVLKLLEKDRDHRFQTAEEVYQRISDLLRERYNIKLHRDVPADAIQTSVISLKDK